MLTDSVKSGLSAQNDFSRYLFTAIDQCLLSKDCPAAERHGSVNEILSSDEVKVVIGWNQIVYRTEQLHCECLNGLQPLLYFPSSKSEPLKTQVRNKWRTTMHRVFWS